MFRMLYFSAFLLISNIAFAAGYKVGIARTTITPKEPIWMSGYASRNHPSEGTLHDLWAKALAIDDGRTRVVIVTTDIIGIPRSVADVIAARVQKQYDLDRSGLLLNSSHTHTGPMIGTGLRIMAELDAHNSAAVEKYTQQFTDAIVSVVGAAIADLQPSTMSFGSGTAPFAVNRREPTPKGIRLGVNPQGPVDRSVPVIKVTKPDGTIRALLFGYACHNTTLTGEHYKISGDYAGFAQIELEKQHPNTTAMFMMLCGGDANPNPRTQIENAEQHGRTLADEVSRVAAGTTRPLTGRVRGAFQTTDLALALHTRETFEEMQKDKSVYRQRLAKAMLKAYDEGRPVRRVVYPVQAISFGRDLTLLALGGEVVVDYALRAKAEFPKTNLVVLGYSNDVMCYIPSARILKEGGYEAVDSMVYYGQPTTFTPEVEESVFQAVRKVMKRVQ